MENYCHQNIQMRLHEIGCDCGSNEIGLSVRLNINVLVYVGQQNCNRRGETIGQWTYLISSLSLSSSEQDIVRYLAVC